MTLTKSVPENVLLKRGTEILFRELGSFDAIRFLTISRKKRIESVKRHGKWQQTLDKDAFFEEIFVPDDPNA